MNSFNLKCWNEEFTDPLQVEELKEEEPLLFPHWLEGKLSFLR